MRVLLLGGTRFLGPAVVAAALAAGHAVTTFSRGRSGPPPDGAEALVGDRSTADGLAVLAGRDWDLVVDTSGYVPKQVGAAARLLADRVGHYVFVSTINVYPDWPDAPVTADSPVHDCPPDADVPAGADFDPTRYGPLKAGCERAVAEHFAGRCTHVRAGAIIGPRDDSGRLPWWLTRIGRGGEVLVPGPPDRPMRMVDARDLAAWCVHCGHNGIAGAFPATGPAGQSSYGELFAACRAATGSAAGFTWVSDDFLVEREVTPWSELPLWAPATAAGLWDVDTRAAEQAGLRCRPVAETVADTAAWLAEIGAPPQSPRLPAPGLDPAKETGLLAAWHAG